jgi:hypothetical protein
MGTASFPCGCAVTSSMFSRMIISVHHCEEHSHLFSDRKSLKQMADEIIAAHRTPNATN